MTGLQGKRWIFFVWDEENVEHLVRHAIYPAEAEEVFFNPYVVRPNKRKMRKNRYRIDGHSNSGRALSLIFENVTKGVARVITGWDI